MVLAAGGGIFNYIGTLTLINSTVSGNMTTGYGGGIWNGDLSTLMLINSTVSGNTAAGNGGGIWNGGTLTLTNSTVSGNAAGNGGGILYAPGTSSPYNGMFTLINSTVSGNTAIGNGGGIIIQSGTFSGNPPDIAQANLIFSTIYGNRASAGNDIAIQDTTLDSNGQEKPINQLSQVRISNSIVAGDPAHPGPDIVGMLTSYGYNLFQDNSGAIVTHAQPDTDKTLSVNDLTKVFAAPVGLRNNGGPTMTYALAPDSPAVDQIRLAACRITVTIKDSNGKLISQYTITTDQRGVKRPGGNKQFCDIGAYEYTDSG